MPERERPISRLTHVEYNRRTGEVTLLSVANERVPAGTITDPPGQLSLLCPEAVR